MYADNPKITNRVDCQQLIANWQKEQLVVGFTSGTFDLLHAGHVQYLTDARQQCDRLVVAINSDQSVKAYKDPTRPIVPEMQRAYLIAALSVVDQVFIFDETNNNQNIELLKPDIYFKAGDYDPAKLSSAPIVNSYGGKVVIVPFQSGLSSTLLIDKILLNYSPKVSTTASQVTYEKRPAIFLDRDGTLVEHVEYLHDPKQVKFFPGALQRLKELKDRGYRLVMVTNQPGIGLGYFTKEDFYKVNIEIFKEASKYGVTFDRVYYSPYGKADKTNCRKPSTGMIERATKDLNLDLERSIVIGDSTVDVQLAKNIDIYSVLVETGNAGKDGLYTAQADYVAKGLAQAVEHIISKFNFSSTISSEASAAQTNSADDNSSKNSVILPDEQQEHVLRSIGHVAGKYGHDLNNLLGSLRGIADLLDHKLTKLLGDPHPLEKQIDLMNTAINRSEDITKQMRGYIRHEPLARVEINLNDTLQKLVDLTTAAQKKPVEILLICTEDFKVLASEVQLTQMLQAVISNAVDAISKQAEKCLVILVSDGVIKESNQAEPIEAAEIVLIDHGKGMSAAALNQAVKAFYTQKSGKIGSGLGLGLPMAKHIVEDHGGQLEIRSKEAVGTAVRILLPLAR